MRSFKLQSNSVAPMVQFIRTLIFEERNILYDVMYDAIRNNNLNMQNYYWRKHIKVDFRLRLERIEDCKYNNIKMINYLIIKYTKSRRNEEQ